MHFAGHVEGTQVELRTVFVVERSVTAAFFFLQNIDFGLEFGVRGDGTRFGNDHTAFHFFLVDTAHQQTHVVAGFPFVEELAEHFDAGTYRFLGFFAETHDFDFVADVDHTGFDTTGQHGTAAGDREDVFNRHQERFFVFARRNRNIAVHSIHQFHDLFFPLRFAVQGTQCGAADDRGVVAVEFVFAQQVAHFQFDEVEHFRVIDHIAFVQEHDDTRNVHLTGEQHVLVGLGHRTVGSGHNEDGTVHLSGTRYHVLHIVGVARAVYVSVVTGCGGILNVRGIDGNTAFFFFRRVVDRVERTQFREAFFSQYGSDRCGQRGFTVVNVADGTDVHVRFRPVEFFFCHGL